MKRRVLFFCFFFFAALALVACRDILGIQGNTTIDGAVAQDGGEDGDPAEAGVVNTMNCGGSLALLTETGNVGVLSMAADDNGVFWTNMIDSESGDVLGWVGGALEPVTQGDVQPIDVQLDPNFVYYNSFNALNGVNGTPTLHAWSRSTNDSVDLPLTVGAGALATSSANLYVGAWQTDMDAGAGVYSIALPLDAGVSPLLLATNVDSPFHVAVDTANVYFDQGAGTNQTGTSLWSIPLEGGAPTVVKDPTNVTSIAIVNGTPYWTTGGQNTVESPSTFKVSLPTPVDVVVDASKTFLYVISENDQFDEIYRIRISDKTTTKCVTAYSIAAIAVTTSHVYFAAFEGGTFGIYDLATN